MLSNSTPSSAKVEEDPCNIALSLATASVGSYIMLSTIGVTQDALESSIVLPLATMVSELMLVELEASVAGFPSPVPELH